MIARSTRTVLDAGRGSFELDCLSQIAIDARCLAVCVEMTHVLAELPEDEKDGLIGRETDGHQHDARSCFIRQLRLMDTTGIWTLIGCIRSTNLYGKRNGQ